MLELKNITKDYLSGENTVHALKGISITLRDSEFVSILGPSGCGKTTTLNIIGGLDRYSGGDLIIDNKSTKEYNDHDWDAYRNHKVGFVFQSYNLIPHQTILSNVVLALTIGGVDKNEKIKLAKEALIKVGLESEMNKFPRQLSGGQMQRVAIARAIINKPQVLLADEPTGALDSVTSVQVLDLLKELSKDHLVVMVTHNNDLANKYSTRIISLVDGLITGDTNPYNPTESDKEESNKLQEENNKQYLNKKGRVKKVGMPFFTSLKLSLSNLKSKIGRTILTCFAGSIGIIGIALVVSVSNGFQKYVDKVEESALQSYPVTISSSNVDITSLMTSLINARMSQEDKKKSDRDYVVPSYVMVDLLESIAKTSQSNNLKLLKSYIDEHYSEIEPYITHVSYGYSASKTAYDALRKDENGEFILKQLEPFTIPEEVTYVVSPQFGRTMMETFMRTYAIWSEVYGDKNNVVSPIIQNQYEVLSGRWPEAKDEVVFVIDSDKTVSDFVLYATGLTDDEEGKDVGDEYIIQLFRYVNKEKDENGNTYENPANDPKYQELFKWTYERIMESVSFYVVPNSAYYTEDSELYHTTDGEDIITYSNIKGDSTKVKELVQSDRDDVLKVKCVGVIMPNPNEDTHSIEGSIAYTSLLTDWIIDTNNASDVVRVQKEESKYCIADYYYGAVNLKGRSWEEIQAMMTALHLPQATVDQFSEENGNKTVLSNYGYVDRAEPSSISFYPKSFEDKDSIIAFIDKYNSTRESNEDKVGYNDYLGAIMGSVSTIINAITYVLIAFVSISLVVSSIMIAIITYISVLERTKEIGILRAMGASKRDVRNIFNAETFITGTISGILGVIISIVLDIPISILVNHLAGIENIASLPWFAGLLLVIISFLLSVISGLIPASFASKCDPVEALRSE